jgi:hypothetical protein
LYSTYLYIVFSCKVMEAKICGKDVLTLSHVVSLKANLYCHRKQDELIITLHCKFVVRNISLAFLRIIFFRINWSLFFWSICRWCYCPRFEISSSTNCTSLYHSNNSRQKFSRTTEAEWCTRNSQNGVSLFNQSIYLHNLIEMTWYHNLIEMTLYIKQPSQSLGDLPICILII